MKTIIITGTPCTGKTTLAIKLSKKLNLYYMDVNAVIKKYGISEGYDKKRKSKIIDTKKLNKALIKEIKNYKKTMRAIKKNSIKISNKLNTKKNNDKKIKIGVIVDSHLSHYLPKKYVDLCIVTKCNLKTLKKRLEKKGYPSNKVRENLDAEIFDVCLNEAKENKHKLFVVNTTKNIDTKNLVRKFFAEGIKLLLLTIGMKGLGCLGYYL